MFHLRVRKEQVTLSRPLTASVYWQCDSE